MKHLNKSEYSLFCFHRAHRDATYPLHADDSFSLLLDSFVFIVKVASNDDTEEDLSLAAAPLTPVKRTRDKSPAEHADISENGAVRNHRDAKRDEDNER
jgi:hypothetical protein